MSQPSVVGSPRSARAKMGCATSYPYSRRITTFVCPIPAYASPSPSPCPPTGRVPRSTGAPVRQRWRRGSQIGSGHYVRCYCIACHHGHSPRRCKRGGRMMDREGEQARCAYEQGQRPAPGLGNPLGDAMTVRLMARGRLQTGPAELSAGLRYTAPPWSCTCSLRVIPAIKKPGTMPLLPPV
jgi:hypothetical protein